MVAIIHMVLAAAAVVVAAVPVIQRSIITGIGPAFDIHEIDVSTVVAVVVVTTAAAVVGDIAAVITFLNTTGQHDRAKHGREEQSELMHTP
jgi:hypothetical protein